MDPVGPVAVFAEERLHLFRVILVTEHHAGSPETDFPDLIVLALHAGVRVHDLDLIARQRHTDRTESVDVPEPGAGGRGELGHTVALQELRLGPVALQEAVHIDFQRVPGAFTADGDDLEAFEVDVAHPGVVEHRRNVVRYGGNEVWLIFVKVLRPVFRVKVRNENDRGPHGERHMHVDERAVHDKGHHKIQEDVFLRFDPEDVMVLERDGVHRVVAQHDRFRETGGTAGVSQQSRRVRVLDVGDVRHMCPCGDELVPGQDDLVLQVGLIDVGVALEECPDLFEERKVVFHAERYDMLDADRLCGQQRLVHEDVGRHDDFRLVRTEELDQVFRGGQDVDEVDDGADLVERVEADDAGHAGNGQDGDDVPFLYALSQERLGRFIDALEELSEADLVPHVVEGVRV